MGSKNQPYSLKNISRIVGIIATIVGVVFFFIKNCSPHSNEHHRYKLVTGKVLTKSGVPIEDARVEIMDKIDKAKYTDTDGRFSISLSIKGKKKMESFEIQVSHEDYKKKKKTVKIPWDEEEDEFYLGEFRLEKKNESCNQPTEIYVFDGKKPIPNASIIVDSNEKYATNEAGLANIDFEDRTVDDTIPIEVSAKGYYSKTENVFCGESSIVSINLTPIPSPPKNFVFIVEYPDDYSIKIDDKAPTLLKGYNGLGVIKVQQGERIISFQKNETEIFRQRYDIYKDSIWLYCAMNIVSSKFECVLK